MDKNSPWNYFERTKCKNAGICKKCSRTIKANGGSTSGLRTHLRTSHDINLLKRQKDDNEISTITINPPTNQASNSNSKITTFFKSAADDSFPAVLSRLIAHDGIPFNKICTSYDLRKLLTDKYKNVPSSPNTVREIVLKYGEKIRKEVIENISKHKITKKAVSLTFDEWTAISNRRYMNINIHTADNFWNIGLARVSGHLPAEKCITLLETKIKEFSISFEDVIAITTDGASVMKKVAKCIQIPIHQLCMAHGIHLAVTKILYNNNSLTDYEEEYTNTSEETSDICDSDAEDDEYEFSESFNILKSSTVNAYSSETNEIQYTDLATLVSKIRKVVKLFRRSPTKNDAILQKYVKEEFGKERNLILDSRTRWNSMLLMLERFSELKHCVRKSLIDITSDITFTAFEFELLSNTILALQPIKVAVDALCCENVNLYMADVTLKFMLNELAVQNTILSNRLKEELIIRIKERRTVYSDILAYLFDRKTTCAAEEDYGIFQKTNKTAITKYIIEIIKRLKKCSTDSTSGCSSSNIIENIPAEMQSNIPSLNISMKEKLQVILKEKSKQALELENKITQDPKEKALAQMVRREIIFFEEEGIKGKYLTMVFESLKTIRPTSVDSERAFSTAGLFCNKIRSCLGDKTLDTLCFLSAYYTKTNC